MAHTPPVPAPPATESTPDFDTPPGLVRYATVLVFIPTDNMEGGKGADTADGADPCRPISYPNHTTFFLWSIFLVFHLTEKQKSGVLFLPLWTFPAIFS
jgi:hypothetical protein